MSQVLKIRDAFPAVVAGGTYAPHLEELRSWKASGIYAIVDRHSRQVLYVGESHTGRLYDTITRHFRSWEIRRGDRRGRTRGGTTYNRDRVLVVYQLTPPELAQQLQFESIQALQPRDNDVQGCANTGGCAPF